MSHHKRLLHELKNSVHEIEYNISDVKIGVESIDDRWELTVLGGRAMSIEHTIENYKKFTYVGNASKSWAVSSFLIDKVNKPFIWRSLIPEQPWTRYCQAIRNRDFVNIFFVVLQCLLLSYAHLANWGISDMLSLNILNTDDDQSGSSCSVSDRRSTLMRFKNNSNFKELFESILKFETGDYIRKLKLHLMLLEIPEFYFIATHTWDHLTRNQYLSLLNKLERKINRLNYNSEVLKLQLAIEEIRVIQSDTEYNIRQVKRNPIFSSEERERKYIMCRTEKSNKIENVVSKFITDDIGRVISTQGQTRKQSGLEVLFQYCITLLENTPLTERSKIDDCYLQLSELSENQNFTPVYQLAKRLAPNFEKVFSNLPLACAEECRVKFESLFYCDNQRNAWSLALRLKGLMYEGLFAKEYSLVFVPEHLKLNITNIVNIYFPEKASEFLLRTLKHPEIRFITPDFFVVNRDIPDERRIKEKEKEESKDYTGSGSSKSGTTVDINYSMKSLDQFEGRLFLPNTRTHFENAIDRITLNKKVLDCIPTGYIYKDEKVLFSHDNESRTFSEVEHLRIHKPDLLIYEVGFVTDNETKIRSDEEKWSILRTILSGLGISCSLIVATDSSDQRDRSMWWISQESVDILKPSIGRLFFEMGQNTPPRITDMVISELSTHRVRMLIKSSHQMKPPILKSDIRKFFSVAAPRILNRPLAGLLPEDIREDFKETWQRGVVINKDRSEDILLEFYKNRDEFSKIIRESGCGFELCSSETKFNFVSSWLLEDSKMKLCNECRESFLVKHSFELSGGDNGTKCKFISDLNLRLRIHGKCNRCDVQFNLHWVTTDRPLYLNRIPTIFPVEEIQKKSLLNRTSLDYLVSAIVPNRTQKEKGFKSSLSRFIMCIMQIVGIQCIKNSKGQLFISKQDLTNREVLTSSDITINPKDVKTPKAERVQSIFETEKIKLCSSSSILSQYLKDIIKDLDISKEDLTKSFCVLPYEDIKPVLVSLGYGKTAEQKMKEIKDTLDSRSNFDTRDDRFQSFRASSIKNYFRDCYTDLSFCMESQQLFSFNCLINNELFQQFLKEASGTVYQYNPVIFERVCVLLLKLNWFNKLVYYSKMCEIFVNIISEFNQPGLKVMKIPHTNTNLFCKLSKKKNANLRCVITDSKFRPITDIFFMSRRQAVLGKSYPSLMAVTLIQICQNYKVIDGLMSGLNDIERCYNDIYLNSKSYCSKTFESIVNMDVLNYQQIVRCNSEQQKDFLRHPSMGLAHILYSFGVAHRIYLTPAFLLNSAVINKQVQTIRYSYMLSLSIGGYETNLGKKFSAPCRRIEAYLMRNYLMMCSYCATSSIEANRSSWKSTDTFPHTSIPSLNLFGFTVCSGRQFLYEIYLCHFYNKEMDDFDSGTINVLEEMGERHFLWESMLEESCNSRKKKNNKMNCRSLLGIPKLDVLKNIKEVHGPNKRPKVSAGSVSSISESQSSNTTAKTYSIKELVLPISFSGDRSDVDTVSSAFGIWTVTDDGPWFNTSQSEIRSNEDLEVLREYIPSVNQVISSCKNVCTINPKFTFGVFEMIQSVTQYAKDNYVNSGILNSAFRDKRNNLNISQITETTSSIRTPVEDFNLRKSIEIQIKSFQKKSIKMIKSKLMSLENNENSKEIREAFFNYMETLMLGATPLLQLTGNSIKPLMESLKVTESCNWDKVIETGVKVSLMTHNANTVYYWIKSLKRDIKKVINLNSNETKEKFHKNFGLSLDENDYDKVIDNITACKEKFDNCWLENMILFSDKYKSIMECDFELMDMDFDQLYEQYREIIAKKEESPEVNYMDLESSLSTSESIFVNRHENQLMRTLNILFLSCLTCPWITMFGRTDLKLLQYLNMIAGFEDSDHDIAENKVTEFLKILNPLRIVKSFVSKVYNYTPQESVLSYCCALFACNDYPMRYMYHSKYLKTNVSAVDILNATRILMGRAQLEGNRSDFFLTVLTIRNSNYELARRLTGRNERERIPRSVRSKVIYEMIEVLNSSGTACVQEIAFSYLMDPNHRIFSTLAPKAQLGGTRDLLVQETKTKIINATSESFSKSLLAQFNCDGLTNPNLKESILKKSSIEKQESFRLHGTQIIDKACIESYKVLFRQTYCISGDSTKWGPIHCCSFFYAMYVQLLSDAPDWRNFMSLVMLKGIDKIIEIPIAAIEKVLNSFLNSNEYRDHLSSPNTITLDEALNKFSIRWEWKPFMKYMVKECLLKGKQVFQSYNHMGQGIHHATSSVLALMVSFIYERYTKMYWEDVFPGCIVTVTHAGSSDDFCKIVTVSFEVDQSELKMAEELYFGKLKDIQDFMFAIMRTCQIFVSDKTVVSDVVCEFYSSYDFFRGIDPAVIKYNSSILINYSCTSPLSICESNLTAAQQAMYMSTPMLTIQSTNLARSQAFVSQAEYVTDDYGFLLMNNISITSIYNTIKYSHLCNGGVSTIDIENILNGLKFIYDLISYIPIMEDQSSDSGSDSESSEELTKLMGYTYSVSLSSGGNKDYETKNFVGHSSTCDHKSEETQGVQSKLLNWIENKGKVFLDEKCELKFGENRTVKSDGRILFKTLKDYNAKTNRFDSIESLLEFYLRSMYSVILYSYYKKKEETKIEEIAFRIKKNLDDTSLLDNPFCQALPESVRQQYSKLYTIRQDLRNDELVDLNSDDVLKKISEQIIEKTVLTENLQSEQSRIVQALSSNTIIWGLSSSMNELSLPIFRQMMRSYLFEDRIGIIQKDTWKRDQKTLSVKETTSKTMYPRVRFTNWISALIEIMTSNISVDRSKKIKAGNPNYLSEYERPVIITSTGGIELVFDYVQTAISDLEMLLKMISDKNRSEVSIIEKSEVLSYSVAPTVTTQKSKIFSASTGGQFSNRISVILANLIHPKVLQDIRPKFMKFEMLISDTLNLNASYPQLRNTVKLITEKIKKDQDLLQVRDINKYVSDIVSLIRLIEGNTSHSVDVYVLKPTKTPWEDSFIPMISNGVIEGMNLKFNTEKKNEMTFSDNYYIIFEVLSIISKLTISYDMKVNLFTSFLMWSPPLTSTPEECEDYNIEEAILALFSGRSMLMCLKEEQSRVKSQIVKRRIDILYNYIYQPSVLISESGAFNTKFRFEYYGNLQGTGSFELYSYNGTAIGSIINGILYLHMNRDNVGLLSDVMSSVLSVITGVKTEAHATSLNTFFDLLPEANSKFRSLLGGQIYTASVRNREGLFLEIHKVLNLQSNVKVFSVDEGLYVRYKQRKERLEDSPKVSFKSDSLVFTVTSGSNQSKTYKGISDLYDLIEQLSGKSVRARTVATDKSQFITQIVGRIPMPHALSRKSFTLFHCFMYHQSTDIRRLLNATKDISRLINYTGAKNTVNIMLRCDNNYSLLHKDLISEMVSSEEYLNTVKIQDIELKLNASKFNTLKDINVITKVIREIGLYDVWVDSIILDNNKLQWVLRSEEEVSSSLQSANSLLETFVNVSEDNFDPLFINLLSKQRPITSGYQRFYDCINYIKSKRCTKTLFSMSMLIINVMTSSVLFNMDVIESYSHNFVNFLFDKIKSDLNNSVTRMICEKGTASWELDAENPLTLNVFMTIPKTFKTYLRKQFSKDPDKSTKINEYILRMSPYTEIILEMNKRDFKKIVRSVRDSEEVRCIEIDIVELISTLGPIYTLTKLFPKNYKSEIFDTSETVDMVSVISNIYYDLLIDIDLKSNSNLKALVERGSSIISQIEERKEEESDLDEESDSDEDNFSEFIAKWQNSSNLQQEELNSDEELDMLDKLSRYD